MMDLVLDRVVPDGALATANKDWYEEAGGPVLDPRRDLQTGLLRARLRDGQADAGLLEWWGERLRQWSNAGVAGFRCLAPAGLPPDNWKALVALVHAQQPECCFMAWTPGLTPEQAGPLEAAGFEAAFLSLPWWDYRSAWLVEEHNRLRRLAPLIAPLEDPGAGLAQRAAWQEQDREQARRKLWTAAFVGDGLLMPMGFEDIVGEQAVAETNRWIAQRQGRAQRLQLLSGPLADVTALFRGGSAPRLFLVNPDSGAAATVDWQALRSRLPHSYTVSDAAGAALPGVLPPADCSLVPAVPAATVKGAANSAGDQRKTITAALRAPRIAIENITPSVDHGRFPIKRALGDAIVVQADVLMDGHDHVAANLLWRAVDEAKWRAVPMRHLGNDRWQAQFSPDRMGRHSYGVQAWLDVWRSYREQLRKKVAAGLDVSLEVEEGRLLVSAALERARDDMPFTANALVSALDAIGRPQSPASRP
ncbi:MAG: maltotransferase domain-containing protein, partial [Pollutimonas bauzanensis]